MLEIQIRRTNSDITIRKRDKSMEGILERRSESYYTSRGRWMDISPSTAAHHRYITTEDKNVHLLCKTASAVEPLG